ncbi:MAG: amidase [Oleiphilus sp.]
MTKLVSDKTTSAHTFCDDALKMDDAVSLASRIAKGEISTLELAQAALSRSKKINPAIWAANFLVDESDLEQQVLASQAVNNHHDRANFFSGIPSFLKDNVAFKGMPTSFGSNAFPPKLEKKTSPYATHFQSLGMTIIGKSSLPEFGFNASTEPAHSPATRNPWNLAYTSGASSGGSAALVASGVVPFAHGNDGGGSIRIPAACCGLVGLKPSRDRHINDHAARSMPINIVSEGIVSRSVRDMAYYHFELEKRYQNANLPPLPLVKQAGEKRLRIGCYTDSITGYSTDKDTREACLRTAEKLAKAGHQVEEMRFPVSAQFPDDFSMYWGMLAYMVKKTGKFTINRHFNAKKLDLLSLGLAQHFRKNAHKTPFMLARLKKHGLMFQQPFDTYDAFLSPVIAQAPRPLGELSPTQTFDSLFDRLMRYASFTPMANIAGTPAISIPAGQTAQGVPIGIQLSAAKGREQRLLELAFELEEIQPWPLLANYQRT